MIAGCIITYNDFPLIKDCVESIKDKVDRIICVDGRYADFPKTQSDNSTDGTLEYLCALDKTNVIMVSGYDEVAKRNRYLQELKDGDIVLNLDSDEVLVGELPELKSDFGILDLWDGCSRHIQKRATRFFKYREGMKYQDVHYTLYFNGIMINKLHNVINPDFSFENIEGCHILHNWHLRTDERKYAKEQYYKTLIQKEAKFTK